MTLRHHIPCILRDMNEYITMYGSMSLENTWFDFFFRHLEIRDFCILRDMNQCFLQYIDSC